MSVSAAIVWSDNFDDGNYDGWTRESVTTDASGMTVVDGSLKATGDNWTEVSHPSDVDTGTWSFDIKDPVTNLTYYEPGFHPNIYNHMQRSTAVHFMMEEPETWNGSSYAIMFMGPSIQLRRYYMLASIMQRDILTTCLFDSVESTLHVDVTLDDAGYFNVFIDGAHRLNFQAVVAPYDWSYFAYGSMPGASVDNIVVQDVVDESLPFNGTETTTETTTTTTTEETTTTTTSGQPAPPIPTEMLILAIGVPVILVVVVVILRFRRS
jgi:hypothetical protein